MKYLALLLTLCIYACQQPTAPKTGHAVSVDIIFDPSIRGAIPDDGRMFIFLSPGDNPQPYRSTWPSPVRKNIIIAKNFEDLDLSKTLKVKNSDGWTTTYSSNLSDIAPGEYSAQVMWDHDVAESRINAPGNYHSTVQKITINGDTHLDMTIDQVIPDRVITEHPLVKVIDMRSELLSEFWDKEMRVKASVLLPHGYKEGRAYPIRYNVAGYGGRYTRIDGRRLMGNPEFVEWWTSGDAPQVINVFLDGEGPYGDSYQMDSDNSGPYGEMLTTELMPHIESQYRGTQSAETRFVDGCSTGGWVSLGLQLYYPDHFAACFSYSPDAIEFTHYQLINIYKDKNAYVNEYGYERPVMRSTYGEPMISFRDFCYFENVLGPSNTLVTSGGQIGSHTALYSPKGADGLPAPMFDPITGEMDSLVAEHWSKYDFIKHCQANWAELGPKLQGKIYIWMGDMDEFYLNTGTRGFADYIATTTDPKSDAIIQFDPMQGHCDDYSHRVALQHIQNRLEGKRM